MDKPKEARPGTVDNLYDAAVWLIYHAPEGHTLEDCRRIDYWRNNLREVGQQRVAGRHAFNTIRCLAVDGAWGADLLVVSVRDNLVHTRLLQAWDWRPKADVPVPAGYVVEYVTGNGWRALEPGGVPLTDKRTTREEALTVAVDHAAKVRPVQVENEMQPQRKRG